MDELLKSQIAIIGQYGLLGALFLGICWRVVMLEKRIATTDAARMMDWKEIGEIVRTNSTVLATWTSSNEARTRAVEATVQSQQLIGAGQISLTASVGTLASEVTGMRDDLQRMREALLQRRVDP